MWRDAAAGRNAARLTPLRSRRGAIWSWHGQCSGGSSSTLGESPMRARLLALVSVGFVVSACGPSTAPEPDLSVVEEDAELSARHPRCATPAPSAAEQARSEEAFRVAPALDSTALIDVYV